MNRALGGCLLLLLCLAGGSPAAERIPVLAWGGPPASEANLERFRELADAGFTHNYSGFSSAAGMADALEVAKATGLKLLISIPELEKSPEEIAKRFKDHPANGGYYLRDEPPASLFPQLAAWAKRIQAIDREHPCYINLFPNYADAGQLGTATYPEHVARFLAEVPVPILSFDHYPVVGKSLRPQWYENLEQIRAAAAGAGKPFWAFALSVAHGPYPIPTLEQLRLQVFSNLAYGAQGIQYFTYWTIKSTEWNFHEGPIGLDGKRTVVYDRVKQVNEEIRGLSGVFLGAKVVSLGHTGTLPSGTSAYQPAAPIVSLKADAGGAVVSLLEKGQRRYLAIVNRDFLAPLSLTLAFDGSAKISEIRKDGSATEIAGREYAKPLAPGDILVLGWENEPPR